jgi:hypothetical protein
MPGRVPCEESVTVDLPGDVRDDGAVLGRGFPEGLVELADHCHTVGPRGSPIRAAPPVPSLESYTVPTTSLPVSPRKPAISDSARSTAADPEDHLTGSRSVPVGHQHVIATDRQGDQRRT